MENKESTTPSIMAESGEVAKQAFIKSINFIGKNTSLALAFAAKYAAKGARFGEGVMVQGNNDLSVEHLEVMKKLEESNPLLAENLTTALNAPAAVFVGVAAWLYKILADGFEGIENFSNKQAENMDVEAMAKILTEALTNKEEIQTHAQHAIVKKGHPITPQTI
jgi:hypothetical protein